MNSGTTTKNDLHARPYGVGLAYRWVIHDAVMHYRDKFDLLEISTADYIVRERLVRGDNEMHLLREALGELPCVAHGLSVSIGSVQAPNDTYLEATRDFLNQHCIATFSDHLAFHELDGIDLSIFLSMPFEEVSIEWLKRAYYHARRKLGRPFALENVTYHFPVPHGSLDEAQFLTRLAEETDCTFLLDATNVFNNAHNHRYDPVDFLDRIPLERVSQIHLAGGHLTREGLWEDSHSAPVMEPVWPLFEEIVRRTQAEIVILERDSNFHEFESVVDDVLQAREIFRKHRPEKPQARHATPELDPIGGEFPDPVAPEFAQLGHFQRTLMARLTDAEFEERFLADPVAACGASLSAAWLRRLRDCDPGALRRVTATWNAIQSYRQRNRVEYENDEWAGWAEKLDVEASSS